MMQYHNKPIHVGQQISYDSNIWICTTATLDGKRGFIFEIKNLPKHPSRTIAFSKDEFEEYISTQEIVIL